MGELVAVDPLGILPHTKTAVDDDAAWFARWEEFEPAAAFVIQDSKWTIAEQDTNVGFTKTVTDMIAGSFRVKICSHPENGSDKLPVVESCFIAGGAGFISDVFALREGRMLGIVRSVPHSLGRTATDKDACYSWGIVPESAKVGDWVATITGSRVMFLLCPQEGARRDVEQAFRTNLPRHGDEDSEIIHCRLRGECRFSGFEDSKYFPTYFFFLLTVSGAKRHDPSPKNCSHLLKCLKLLFSYAQYS